MAFQMLLCVASVTKRFKLKGIVQGVELWIACKSLSVNLFVTLAIE
jgi:hypothetical protein